MRGGGRHGRRLGERSRRRLAILITLILLAMIAGLAAGLVASLAHLTRASRSGSAVPPCILTAMTSLALLTRAAAPPFNGLFYATVATIIPVLFLAIAVQGRVLDTLVNAATNAAHDYQRAVRSRTLLKATFTGLRSVYPIATAILVVAYGAVGEIMAITALQSQTGGTQTFVATAAVLLTLVTAAGPALTCGKSLLKVLSLLTADSPGTADAITSTAPTPPTEPGRTNAQGTENAGNLRGRHPQHAPRGLTCVLPATRDKSMHRTCYW